VCDSRRAIRWPKPCAPRAGPGDNEPSSTQAGWSEIRQIWPRFRSHPPPLDDAAAGATKPARCRTSWISSIQTHARPPPPSAYEPRASPGARTVEQISNSPTGVGRPPPFQARELRGERRSQMARLESIRRRGTPGRPGDSLRGTPPQPPVPPQPPQPPKVMTPTGRVQGQVKAPPTRKRRDGGGADKPTYNAPANCHQPVARIGLWN
jgi:hypothetical protein